jgi:uncharacterized protein YbbK (DUF523 family)
MGAKFHLPAALAQRPRPGILVSACLAGDRVRYDGTDKALPDLMPLLESHLRVQRLCPEVAAGLGVPRPPVQWVESGHDQRLLGVEDSSLRVDPALQQVADDWCQKGSDIVCGILKARSPSCGSGTTPIYDTAGKVIRMADGLFAREIKRQRGICVIDESFFCHRQAGHWFILGCYLANDDSIPDELAGLLGWQGDLEQFLSTAPNQQSVRLEACSAEGK